jgi:Holliday junction resolvasome RuvABC DNA-binding subunit
MPLLHQPSADAQDEDADWFAALFVLGFFARDIIGSVNHLRNQPHIQKEEIDTIVKLIIDGV